MGDGAAEGGFVFGALGIKMDPLLIPRRFRKEVDFLLVDENPAARAEGPARVFTEFADF